MRYIYISLLFFLGSCAFKSEKADIILHNGVIYTLNSNKDVFRAIAIKDGKILDIGPENHIMNKYSAEKTVDLAGKVAYPGFIDSHCHFLGLGESLLWANLVGTNSFEEVVSNLESYNSKFTHNWILGRGWDQNDWENQEFPSNKMLNELFPDQPVYLARIDGHAALVNDYALQLAGITCYTDIEGGSVIKESLECTGVLVDNAMELVSSLIPDLSEEDKKLALRLAEKKCISAGLTTVDDAGLMHDDILFIDSLQKTGEIKMQVYAMFSDDEQNYSFFEKNGPIKTKRLLANSFKFYADGALGSRGACLIKPYADKPAETGFLLKDSDYFRKKAIWIYDNKLQMNTHCIGDSANRVILNIYADQLKVTNDLRWRIEHCQIVHNDDMKLFKDYNIVPSVQPLHATSDYPWFLSRLGKRNSSAYSYQKLLSQSGLVALGTDFPVETHNPIHTFYSAVFRKNIKGQPINAIQPAESLTREQALYGMTLWPALANFQENEKGTLEIGKNADIVITDRDLLKVEEKYIPETIIKATYILGEEVYNN